MVADDKKKKKKDKERSIKWGGFRIRDVDAELSVSAQREEDVESKWAELARSGITGKNVLICSPFQSSI